MLAGELVKIVSNMLKCYDRNRNEVWRVRERFPLVQV